MCRVQRVVNSCAHVNDHVLMTCREAKPRSPSPSAAPVSGFQSLSSVPLGALNAQTPAQLNAAAHHGTGSLVDLVVPSLIIRPASQQTENTPPNNGTGDQGNGQSIVVGTGQPGLSHASTQPYCTGADIKHLSTAAGFECMVPGCGRVG
jgi:hypothetical protein